MNRTGKGVGRETNILKKSQAEFDELTTTDSGQLFKQL